MARGYYILRIVQFAGYVIIYSSVRLTFPSSWQLEAMTQISPSGQRWERSTVNAGLPFVFRCLLTCTDRLCRPNSGQECLPLGESRDSPDPRQDSPCSSAARDAFIYPSAAAVSSALTGAQRGYANVRGRSKGVPGILDSDMLGMRHRRIGETQSRYRQSAN